MSGAAPAGDGKPSLADQVTRLSTALDEVLRQLAALAHAARSAAAAPPANASEQAAQAVGDPTSPAWQALFEEQRAHNAFLRQLVEAQRAQISQETARYAALLERQAAEHAAERQELRHLLDAALAGSLPALRASGPAVASAAPAEAAEPRDDIALMIRLLEAERAARERDAARHHAERQQLLDHCAAECQALQTRLEEALAALGERAAPAAGPEPAPAPTAPPPPTEPEPTTPAPPTPLRRPWWRFW